jgi:hypothetical protein
MINILKRDNKDFLDENEIKILNEYSQTEQEQQVDSIILEEDDTIFDQTLAKILIVAVATTTLFFLKNV